MSRFCIAVMAVCLFAYAGTASADVVTDWNNVALNAIRSDGTPPPKASRALAMMHSAVFDAVNSVDPLYQSYHANLSPAPGTCPTAAAAVAAHDVLVSVYPTQAASLDAALAISLSKVSDGAWKTQGISLGHDAANQILTWRSTDNSSLVVPYTPGTQPGQWRPTPPAYAPALLPNWPMVTPFCMTSGSQMRGSGPPSMQTAEYAADVNETKSLGAFNSTTRTTDQTQIALFWADGGGTSTPPGHWNQIAQQIAAQKGNTLSQNARLFALLNISMADAAICAWDDKYAYNAWRPIAAIREADSIGNPLITQESNWTPLLTTPNFPEYLSGHSTFSGAAAEVLADFYGTDNIDFTIGSDGMPEVYRAYSSFSQAALEAGRSRIYGGIHFEFSDGSGIQSGRAIGSLAFDNEMQPIPEPSTLGLAILSAIGGIAAFRRRR